MHSLALLSLLPLALAAPSQMHALPIRTSDHAPIIKARAGQAINGSYIIVLKDTVQTGAGAEGFSISGGSKILSSVSKSSVYGVLGGFAATLSEEELLEMRKAPEVEFIEENQVITINDYVTQDDATWGLHRISHRKKKSGTTDKGAQYVYDETAGEGTCSYVVDTGIYVDHNEFEGRATWVANFADDDDTDGNGHGTHVAGTIGSKSYGVAKKTQLYAVKVLSASGSGSTEGVIQGMEFVIKDAAGRSCPKGVVVNMSLGGGRMESVNKAARALVNAGIFLAVAAGNDAEDASNSSPASEPLACTVGASASNDQVASFSNYGSVVDIFAPGVKINSTWIGGPDETNSISGTSMASPHIAGLGAYLLGLLGERTPQELCDYIRQISTRRVITNLPNGTVNYLAFNGNPSG